MNTAVNTPSKKGKYLAWAIALLLVALAPGLVIDPYFRNVLVLCGIYALLAVALDMLVGFLGIDSFGHAAFFGGGAYVTAILMRSAEWPFWAALPAGALAAGALGALISIPALRVRGVYFAITTLACAEILRLVVVNTPGVTRGVMGLSVPTPSLPFVEEGNETLAYYYLIYAMLVVVCLLFQRFAASARGRALVAIRENELLASSVGVPAFRLKACVFAVSALVAGLAGGVYAPFVGILSPDVMGVSYSALALLMVIVGGKGTLYGAVLGAVMFSVVTEFFRVANDLRMIVFSGMLVLSILLTPRGIVMPLLKGLRRAVGGREPTAASAAGKEAA